MNSVLFVERDGVVLLRQARKKINNLWDAHFYEYSMRALKKGKGMFYQIILVSSNENIRAGTSTAKEQAQINNLVVDRVRHNGGNINDVYLGDIGESVSSAVYDMSDEYRKSSYLLTDRLSSIEVAIANQIKPVLVLSGHGARSLCELLRNGDNWPEIWNADPLVCRDLYSFVDDDLVLPLSVYAKASPTPCEEVAHSNSVRIQQSLSRYIEAVRKAVQEPRTAGL